MNIEFWEHLKEIKIFVFTICQFFDIFIWGNGTPLPSRCVGGGGIHQGRGKLKIEVLKGKS